MKNDSHGEGGFAKIRSTMQAVRRSIIYPVLLLQVVLRKDTTPLAHKVLIVSALAYFFLRNDLISDFHPVVGYIDDIAALLGAISTVARNVTPTVEAEAKADYDAYFDESPDAAA